MKVILGVLIPFIGTIIGAACVYVMKKEINKKLDTIINNKIQSFFIKHLSINYINI